MAIKKGILICFSGITIEVVMLWLSDYLLHWGLRRIAWRSVFVWAFFFAGFFSFGWLMLWTKICKRFSRHKESSSDSTPQQVASMSTMATPTATPAAPTTPIAPSQQPSSPETPSSTTPPPVARPAFPRMAPPMRMAVQNNAILTMNPNAPETPQAPAAKESPIASMAPATPSQKEQDIVTLSDIDPDLDMMAFKHVALEGNVIDLVYSSDDVAILCKLFSEEHTWTVDITQTIENCVWTNEAGATQKPCAVLLAQAAALEKMESEAEIMPALVMIRGTIQNYQQVAEYLLQNQITLVQYENGKMPDAKSLHNLLKEKFSLYDEEDITEGEAEDEGTEENIPVEEETTSDVDIDDMKSDEQVTAPDEQPQEETTVQVPEEGPNG